MNAGGMSPPPGNAAQRNRSCRQSPSSHLSGLPLLRTAAHKTGRIYSIGIKLIEERLHSHFFHKFWPSLINSKLIEEGQLIFGKEKVDDHIPFEPLDGRTVFSGRIPDTRDACMEAR